MGNDQMQQPGQRQGHPRKDRSALGPVAKDKWADLASVLFLSTIQATAWAVKWADSAVPTATRAT